MNGLSTRGLGTKDSAQTMRSNRVLIVYYGKMFDIRVLHLVRRTTNET